MSQEALEELDVEWVIQDEGLDYKESWGHNGRQLNLRHCPFCGNNKYKVYINADTGLGNCFAGSCSQGSFNKWQFLREVYDLTGRDLHRKIEDAAGEQGWKPKTAVKKFDPGPLNLPDCEAAWTMSPMPKYLVDRGVTSEIAEHFDLGYCESGWFVVKDPAGEEIKQNYAKRIIIPVYDVNGEIVSFQGRDTTGTSDRRYLFPPMFSGTGTQLYNIQNWKVGMESVVIAEGAFDAIGVYRALKAKKLDSKMLAAASFGMSFTESPNGNDQISRLLELKERGLKEVIFMWDDEAPAIKAAIAACKKVKRYGLRVKIAIVKGAKDPGDATVDQIMDALRDAKEVRSDMQAMLLERQLTG
ncbi:DNA primase [Stenotrophomonas phage BUCTxx99]|nr:DNA primase [Stenotrophomonas phage BUCTxx99]